MEKRNKQFIPIVNNGKMPTYKDKNSGCINIIIAGIVISILAALAALGFGIYFIVKYPRDILLIICLLVITLVAWGIIALIFNGVFKLFNKGD